MWQLPDAHFPDLPPPRNQAPTTHLQQQAIRPPYYGGQLSRSSISRPHQLLPLWRTWPPCDLVPEEDARCYLKYTTSCYREAANARAKSWGPTDLELSPEACLELQSRLGEPCDYRRSSGGIRCGVGYVSHQLTPCNCFVYSKSSHSFMSMKFAAQQFMEIDLLDNLMIVQSPISELRTKLICPRLNIEINGIKF